jgi:RNA-directed DNA polymerase
MNDRGKSDSRVVPVKRANNTGRPVAEPVEERRLAKGNTGQQNAPRTLSRDDGASSALERVRQAAQKDKKARFTALLHHVDLARLWAAYAAISPKAAPGVDQVTWAAYGQDLRANLEDLLRRVHSGAYRASPSRRVYIPKPDGRQRPLGIATLEDKVVQRAVAEVLNAIYEEDFLGFSYGFRPGRKPHAIDHEWLRKFVEHRIADKRVLRLIQKWLNAGVIEDGSWSASEEGAPQGASASPLLANVYLHYVFDLWARQWRNRQAHGDVIIVRFADDIVVGFQDRSDAERFHADLVQRFARFNLELNAEKTRLIEFGRFAAQNRRRRGLGRPETFAFLGFTHLCGKTRAGRFALRRKTIAKKMAAKLREVNALLRQRRHWPVAEQGQWLGSVVRGHTAYYGVPGNIAAVSAFRKQVTRLWGRSLRRRSQRHRLTWERMRRLEARWLPAARITHPWPNVRFDARTQGRSPVR